MNDKHYYPIKLIVIHVSTSRPNCSKYVGRTVWPTAISYWEYIWSATWGGKIKRSSTIFCLALIVMCLDLISRTETNARKHKHISSCSRQHSAQSTKQCRGLTQNLPIPVRPKQELTSTGYVPNISRICTVLFQRKPPKQIKHSCNYTKRCFKVLKC